MPSNLHSDLELFPTPSDEAYIQPHSQDFRAAFEMPANLAAWPSQGLPPSASSPNALSRYLQQEEPWNTARVGNSLSSPTSAPRGRTDRYPVRTFRQMQAPVISDTVSAQDDPPLSDSAYFTGPRSDVSAEPIGHPDEHMEVENSLMFMKPFSTPTRVNVPVSAESTASPLQREVTSSPTGRNRTKPDLHLCPYQDCREQFKIPSQLKKHVLKHDKPFKCNIRGCSRAIEGFTTTNDLDRHNWTKHQIVPRGRKAKVYRCASRHCVERSKEWPRLDNFKQHVERMHKKESLKKLIEDSEVTIDDSEPSSNFHINAASDMGEEKVVDNVEHTSTASQYHGIHHPGVHPGHPDQTSDWTSWDHPEYPTGPDPQILTAPQSAVFSDTDSIHSPMVDPALSYAQAPSYPVSEGHQHSMLPTSDANSPPYAQGQPLLSPQPSNPPSQAETSPESRQNPSVVIHQPEDSKQRQEEDLIHILATKCDSKPVGETTEQTIRRVLDDLKNDSAVNDNEGSAGVLSSPTSRRSNTMSSGESVRGAPRIEIAPSPHQNQTSAPSRISSPRESSPPAQINGVRCRMCAKVLPRNCDRRKHENRHKRPFGCTFDNCKKRFGSKNDWKRHENSQHFQEELFRCDEPSKKLPNRPCAELLSTRDDFATHLARDHGLMDKRRISSLCGAKRIGRNGEKSFWCGFCCRITPLKATGLKAWDERFDHIGNHFKDGKRIDEWLPPGEHITKGEILIAEELKKQQEEEGEEVDAVGSPDYSHDQGESDAPPQLLAYTAGGTLPFEEGGGEIPGPQVDVDRFVPPLGIHEAPVALTSPRKRQKIESDASGRPLFYCVGLHPVV
ncbi:MAG: hypothetical protein M1831_002799 [Alyxoria varia]|nr:MAG: hypothetical protein M1831_002799 [Alyxoria varia]